MAIHYYHSTLAGEVVDICPDLATIQIYCRAAGLNVTFLPNSSPRMRALGRLPAAYLREASTGHSHQADAQLILVALREAEDLDSSSRSHSSNVDPYAIGAMIKETMPEILEKFLWHDRETFFDFTRRVHLNSMPLLHGEWFLFTEGYNRADISRDERKSLLKRLAEMLKICMYALGDEAGKKFAFLTERRPCTADCILYGHAKVLLEINARVLKSPWSEQLCKGTNCEDVAADVRAYLVKIDQYVKRFDSWLEQHGPTVETCKHVDSLHWPSVDSLPRSSPSESSLANAQSVQESNESKSARRKDNWRVVFASAAALTAFFVLRSRMSKS